MVEQKMRRVIMQAANDEQNRNVILTLTFHDFDIDETADIERQFSEFWEKLKPQLHLNDLPEEQVEAAALKRG